ncbi:uncharacterized protein [Dermacentor albipictus]|uniref:uncharacterized protein isoform X1 n=1 Tax=Dermacentor albipictus TaxID=60249 RepID=UPI0031FC9697
MLVARALHGLVVAHGSNNAGAESQAKCCFAADECQEQTIDVLLNVLLVKGDAGLSCRLTWSSTGGRIVADYANQASKGTRKSGPMGGASGCCLKSTAEPGHIETVLHQSFLDYEHAAEDRCLAA